MLCGPEAYLNGQKEISLDLKKIKNNEEHELPFLKLYIQDCRKKVIKFTLGSKSLSRRMLDALMSRCMIMGSPKKILYIRLENVNVKTTSRTKNTERSSEYIIYLQ